MNNNLAMVEEKSLSRELELRRGGIEDALHDMGLDLTIVVNCVWKNNTRVYGYMVVDETKNVQPNIYITEEMLAQSDEELASIIARMIPRTYLPTNEIKRWLERDFLLLHTFPRLIADNETNRKGIYIRGLVNMQWEELGLLITFAVVVPFGSEHSSIALTDAHIQNAGVAISELYSAAIENITAKMKFISMGDLLKKMIGDVFDKNDYNAQMWVLTTEDNWQGAALLLSDRAVETINETVGCDEWYVLPSSIHEVIILPRSDDFKSNVLLQTVTEVNSAQVAIEDRLADAVFSHSKDGFCRIAAVI